MEKINFSFGFGGEIDREFLDVIRKIAQRDALARRQAEADADKLEADAREARVVANQYKARLDDTNGLLGKALEAKNKAVMVKHQLDEASKVVARLQAEFVNARHDACVADLQAREALERQKEYDSANKVALLAENEAYKARGKAEAMKPMAEGTDLTPGQLAQIVLKRISQN